jgi:uncharacterized protein YdeI (BOF family)
MKSFRVVVLFCMFVAAWAAFAQQGSMQQPAQTPQTAPATSQNPQMQSPQATTPQAQSPQMQSPQSPAMQTPQGQPSQAPPMHSGGSGADAQVNALTQALNLNSDQQARIKTILEDQHQQAMGVVNDNSLSQDAKLQKVHAIRQSTIDKVRGTLTTDDQKSKFDTMIQASNERIRQREQQEQQQNGTPQPK